MMRWSPSTGIGRGTLVVVSLGTLVLASCDLGVPAKKLAVPGNLLESVDADGDGDLDLLVAAEADSVTFLVGDGIGGFATDEKAVDLDLPNRRQVAAADVNGDGEADLFVLWRPDAVTCEPMPDCLPDPPPPNPAFVSLVLSDGAGGFTAPVTVLQIAVPAYADDESTVRLLDVDEDGNLDLVVNQQLNGAVVVRLGDGSGGFGSSIASSLGHIVVGEAGKDSLHLVDVDGDGHLDIVIGGIGLVTEFRGMFTVLWGDGTGAFPIATDFFTVLDPGPGSGTEGIRQTAVGDFDCDGKLDLVGLDWSASDGNLSSFSLLLGNGVGGFAPAVTVPAPAGLDDIAAGDFDGDSCDDLVVSKEDKGAVLFGATTDQYSESHSLGAGGQSVVAADLTGDGNPEATVRSDGLVTVFISAWGPPPNIGTPPLTFDAPGAVSGTGDVDGDGHGDIVTSSNDDYGVLLGDGTGGFSLTTAAHIPRICAPPDDVCTLMGVSAVADLDLDGRTDLVVRHTIRSTTPEGTQFREEYEARLATGTGGFRDPVSLMSTDSAASLVVGEVTSDGVPDVVVVEDVINSTPRDAIVWPGNGTGGVGAPITTSFTRDVAFQPHQIEDVNGDGHGDLVVSGLCGAPSAEFVGCFVVQPGDGSGNFGAPSVHSAADVDVDTLSGCVMADANEDGSPDMLCGNSATGFDGGANSVSSRSTFLGDGAGGFGPEVSAPAAAQTTVLAAADIDGDVHVDLITSAGAAERQLLILFGDGTGGFGDGHPLSEKFAVVADFDADGKPDVAASPSGGLKVYMNRLTGRP